jgi:hypothetical protein
VRITTHVKPANLIPILLLTILLSGCGKRHEEARATPPTVATLSGHWTGTATIAGLDTVAVALDLGQVGSRWVGHYDVAEYNADDYPLDVTVDSLVTLQFSGIEADFEGRLEGNTLAGDILFEGKAFPTRFVRKGAPEFSAEFLALESASDQGTRLHLLSADARELRDQFNADRNRARLVLLLSPS